MLRIGHGYDVHAFTEGDCITLGGVRIPFHKTLLAHSDGDVALHALCDALLGAAALGDIGIHFPDTDPSLKGIDSRKLLHKTASLLKQNRYSINNIDITLIAQAPRLAPHIAAMRENIAADLQIDANCVNLKATTTERLGYIGRGEGIAVHAVALIQDA